MRLCDFLLMINSNVGHISHRLATIHLLETTDGQTSRRQTTTRGTDALRHNCSA